MIAIIIGNFSFSATESRESHDYNRLKIPQAHSKKYAQFDDIATSLGNVNFKVAIYTVHGCVCQLSHEEEPFPKQFSSNLSKIHKDPYQRVAPVRHNAIHDCNV